MNPIPMEENIIISRYTYLFKTSKGKYLAYSSKTNSFIELSEELFNVLKGVSKGTSGMSLLSIPVDIISMLKREGLICSSTDDDDYVLKSQFVTQSHQHNRDHLNLVLVPTLNCNFNCPYCFESEKRASFMSDETIDELMTFIKRFNGATQINLTWYGGEPLIGIKTIEKILAKLHKETRLPIKRHYLITNGYLINESTLSIFKKYPLDNIQITFDGVKNRHDILRCLKTSKAPTFDTIMENIGLVLDQLPNTVLHIRVNVDRNSIDDYFQIRSLIQEKFDNPNIIVYPGIIRLENEEKTNIVEPAMDRWETAELLFQLYSGGFLQEDIYPVLRPSKTCCAQCVNSFIIGPIGEIYKCWNDVSDSNKIVGYIQDQKITNPSLFYRYHEGCMWYNDPNCLKCFFMPICNGKCAWYNERNLYHNGHFNLCQCLQKAPGLLDKCLEYYYNQTVQKSFATHQ